MEIIYIILILSILLVMAVFCYFLIPKEKKKKYDFLNYNIVDIPYVSLDIQGHNLNMIVDTGCGSSILHKSSVEEFGIKYTETNKRTTLSALTHETIDTPNIFVDYNLLDERVRDEFILYDAKEFGNFNTLYGIQLHGLLGNDFFNAHKCSVDFENHTLNVKK